MSQDNNGLLPQEVMKKIASNLDQTTYNNLTKTCKEMNQLSNDELFNQAVMDESNALTNHYELFHQATIKESGSLIDEDMFYNKNKTTDREEMDHLLEKELFLDLYISNIIFECIALIMLFSFVLLYALKLHGDIELSYGVISLFLLPTIIIFGVFPYITFIIGIKRQKLKLDAEFLRYYNAFVHPLHGLINLVIQLSLWNPMIGTRIFIFLIFDITYFLFVLYSFEVFRFGYVLIPVMIYCVILLFTGCFRWSFTNCVDNVNEFISIYLGIHMYTVYLPLFAFCILVMLKNFELINTSYTVCSIPLMISLWLYLFVYCATFGVFSYLCCSHCGCSEQDCILHLEELDAYLGIDNTKKKYYGDCSTLLSKTCVGTIVIPLIFTSLIFYVLWLDGIYTGSEFTIFIPLLISILLVTTIFEACSSIFTFYFGGL
ncbi:F-box domain containing membrane protein [Entamoeba marina]